MPVVVRPLKPFEVNALSPRKAPYAVGGVPGLMVRVTELKNESKKKVFSYLLKYTDSKGRHEISIGRVSLADARAKAKEYRKDIEVGESPLA